MAVSDRQQRHDDEHGADDLRQHRRDAHARNAHVQHEHEEQVQHDVRQAADDQEVQWPLGVATARRIEEPTL